LPAPAVGGDVKHLPKHLRPRRRYLAVELRGPPDASLDSRTLQRELWFSAQNLIGDAGSADVDLSVVDFDFRDGEGHAVVRTRRGEDDRSRAVVACLSEVGGTELGVRVRGVSGTVRACKDKFL
jgi:ribonuclease P/MRP protein subunit POP5